MSPPVLVVITSSCQLYSGTGTTIFDWISFARDRLDFSVLIDTGDLRNASLAAQFCHKMGIDLLLSSANVTPGCPDFGVREVARVIRSRPWRLVECYSWANSATNLDVLNSIPDDVPLAFTPIYQPSWTLSGHERFFMLDPVLNQMLRRANLIVTLSPNELDDLQLDESTTSRLVYIPAGVDINVFRQAKTQISRAILSVSDFRERRKRVDLLFAGFAAALRHDPDLRLIIAGNQSTTVEVPGSIRQHVDALGYISIESLVEHYRSAGAFALLSDYEGFGIPIAEALCCGTPVIIHRQAQLQRIFAGLPGVRMVENSNSEAVGEAMVTAVAHSANRGDIAVAAAEQFNFEATYGRKLDRVIALCNRSHDEEADTLANIM
jgi:glycosyltransferase involved in cell wall biosynthesis